MSEKLIPGWVPAGLWLWSGVGFLLSIWLPGAENMGAGVGLAAMLFTILWLIG